MANSAESRHPDYYEAILQLRDCSKEAISFLRKEMSESGVSVAKIVEEKNGLDFYLADKRAAKSLGRKLREKFGGDYLITATLWGMKKDREVYRLTVLYRGINFKKGDKVEYLGEEHEVKLLLDNKLILQNLKTGGKKQVKYKELKGIKKKNN